METEEKKLEWTDLGLAEPILELLHKEGFHSPTPIQHKTIPISLKGEDLIASAKTGSGKTASFCLPLIQKFLNRRGTYGLILCPTREIALQTQQTIDLFGKPLGVCAVSLIGGVDIKIDLEALKSTPSILVGTPGRICDHLERGNLWLEFIEVLVLDEADKMLDMGFANELSRITKEITTKHQTLLFSATMPPTVDNLARKILHKPQRVAIGKALSVSSSVQHELLWVNERTKKRELLRIINSEKGPIIIFVSTKDEASHLWRQIHAAGIHESTFISSNKLQQHREQALASFKSGEFRVLVATDVAGRGIHVDDVSLVINYDLPREPEDYIHRIGRTGRKDAKGLAISLVTPSDLRKVKEIEAFLRQNIPEKFAYDFRSDEPKRQAPRGGSRGRSSGPRRR